MTEPANMIEMSDGPGDAPAVPPAEPARMIEMSKAPGDAPGCARPATHLATLPARIAALDMAAIGMALNARGCATTGPLLTPAECAALVALYDGEGFRSHIIMARHGFGRGEYKYFADPLPAPVRWLREGLYEVLAPVARDWARRMGRPEDYPARHAAYAAACHAAGQTRPTPLLLRYGPGDYNCLHQDLYGDLHFPLQAALLLTKPEDFEGGEFVLTEQRPRMQSRAEVVTLRQGEAVIFAVNDRPVRGARGDYRVKLRHGVSRLRTGTRHTLGVIFHDAQ